VYLRTGILISVCTYRPADVSTDIRLPRNSAVIITVASHKGGVGKTTTAFHLAAFFQQRASTLLLDGDETRNATAWCRRGRGVAFKVADEVQAAKLAPQFTHIVIDTGQKPRDVDLQALTEGCDLLILPSVPATLDTEGLVLTIDTLTRFGTANFKVLLTKVPPFPEPDGRLLRTELERQGIPIFKADIPRLKAFEKAASLGAPVSEILDDPRAKRGWEAYTAVGEEALSHV
jgi:chromosome partitioning protein